VEAVQQKMTGVLRRPGGNSHRFKRKEISSEKKQNDKEMREEGYK
jgi:hypothetical protein